MHPSAEKRATLQRVPTGKTAVFENGAHTANCTIWVLRSPQYIHLLAAFAHGWL